MNTQHNDREVKKITFKPQKKTNASKSTKNKRILLKESIYAEKKEIPVHDGQQQKNLNDYQQEKMELIQQIIGFEGKKTSKSFQIIMQIYESSPQLFHVTTIIDKRLNRMMNIPLLFGLVKAIVSNYDQIPQQKREKIKMVFVNLCQYISERENFEDEEIFYLEQINEQIWRQNNRQSLDSILQDSINYFIRISLILSQLYLKQAQEMATKKMIKTNFKEIIQSIRTDHHSETFSNILNSYFSEIQSLLDSQRLKKYFPIPLLDFAIQSISSTKYKFIYQNIMKKTTDLITRCNKKDQQNDFEGQCQKNHQKKVRILLSQFNLFDFDSCIQRREQKSINLEQKVILVFFNYQSLLLKIIVALKKVEKSSIPDSMIIILFNMAIFCHKLNKTPQLKTHVISILTNTQFRNHFQVQGISKTENTQVIKSQLTKQCLKQLWQKIFFKIMLQIEELFSQINIEIYLDKYVANPIFNRDIFLQSIFNHPVETIQKFMLKFTQIWLQEFDFILYLRLFIQNCVKTDRFRLLGSYIQKIDVNSLIKINYIIFQMSFQDDKKKNGIPESNDEDFQLAHLTSAGFADKYAVINKIFPSFTEQLVWKQFIRSVISTQNNNYFLVKAFYNVVYFQIDFSEQNDQKIQLILNQFEQSITLENMEYISSIHHLLCCIFFKRKSEQQYIKNKKEQRMLQIITNKRKDIENIAQRILKGRRQAMKNLSSQISELSVNNNINYSQKIKRIKTFFHKNLLRWIENVENVSQKINQKIPYQEVIQNYKALGKDSQIEPMHLIRQVSSQCSQNYFASTLHKISKKLTQNSTFYINQLRALRQMFMVLITKGHSSQNQFCLSEEDVLNIYASILKENIGLTRQIEQLKRKLFILQNLLQIVTFFIKNQDHQFSQHFLTIFHDKFKEVIIDIAVHNPILISRYEKQLILHLRIAAIQLILLFYKTDYGILDDQDIFGLLLQLITDKYIEIRLMVLTILISKYKKNEYHRLIWNKYRVASYLSIFAIFEPTPIIQKTAKSMIQLIKKSAEQNSSFGFIVLLYSLKMILNDIFKSLLSNDTKFIYIHRFLSYFDELWLNKKQWQYVTYYFATKILEQKKINFSINQLSYNRYDVKRRYNMMIEKQDSFFQNQIKPVISFQFPPNQIPKDLYLQFKEDIKELSFIALKKIQQLIIDKARPVRYLKSKKDFLIHWDVLEQEQIIYFENLDASNSTCTLE